MKQEHTAGPTRWTYIIIFGILVILTIVEIFVANITGYLRIPGLVLTSVMKVLLVVFYYMHLKDESRLYWLTFFLPLVLVIPLLLMITQ